MKTENRTERFELSEELFLIEEMLCTIFRRLRGERRKKAKKEIARVSIQRRQINVHACLDTAHARSFQKVALPRAFPLQRARVVFAPHTPHSTPCVLSFRACTYALRDAKGDRGLFASISRIVDGTRPSFSYFLRTPFQ